MDEPLLVHYSELRALRKQRREGKAQFLRLLLMGNESTCQSYLGTPPSALAPILNGGVS